MKTLVASHHQPRKSRGDEIPAGNPARKAKHGHAMYVQAGAEATPTPLPGHEDIRWLPGRRMQRAEAITEL